MYTVNTESVSSENKSNKTHTFTLKTDVTNSSDIEDDKTPINTNENLTFNQNNSEESLVIPKSSLSILITNLGLNNHVTNLAIDLPFSVALGFSPYTKTLEEYLKITTNKKLVSLVNIPLQFNDPFHDAGPLALSDDYQSLDLILNKYSHNIIGLYTEPGEIFSQNSKAMERLLIKLQEKKLLLCYSGNNNEIKKIATKLEVPLLQPDMVIDDTIDSLQLKNMLSQINENLVGKNKKFLLSMNASVGNLTILSEWIANSTKNFIVVSIDMLY